MKIAAPSSPRATPTIHPKRDKVHLAEQGLEVDALVEQALGQVERLVIE